MDVKVVQKEARSDIVTSDIMAAYENLACEIVLIACRDYRRVLKRIKRNGEEFKAVQEKESLERFFRSEWFGILCRFDPEELMRRLQEEVIAG